MLRHRKNQPSYSLCPPCIYLILCVLCDKMYLYSPLPPVVRSLTNGMWAGAYGWHTLIQDVSASVAPVLRHHAYLPRFSIPPQFALIPDKEEIFLKHIKSSLPQAKHCGSPTDPATIAAGKPYLSFA